MKKKALLLLFLVCSILLISGCGNTKKENTSNSQDSKESSASEEGKIDLYSDNTKIVFANGTNKLVFYYSGNKITAYHAYYDYSDTTTATAALAAFKSAHEEDDSVKKIYTKGNYIVVEFAESEYEDMTVSELKTAYSYLEEVQKNK